MRGAVAKHRGIFQRLHPSAQAALNRALAGKSAVWVPLIVFGATVLASLIAWSYALTASRSEDALRFHAASLQARSAVRSRIDRQVALLQGAAGFLAASPHAGREEFRAFVSRVSPASDYTGALGLGYTVRLTPDAVVAFEERMRTQGVVGFRVHPRGPRPEMHSIAFLEPHNAVNARAIGYDMSTEPVRREAMERARDSGEAAATGRVYLVQDEGQRDAPGFLIYVPVYQGGGVPDTLEARQRSLNGYVYSPFRVKDLFDELLREEAAPRVHLEIYDGSVVKEENLLYRTRPEDAPAPRFEEEATISIGGRDWAIRTTDHAEFRGVSWGPMVHLIPVVGLALGSLLFVLTTGLVREREAAERHAEETRRGEYRSRLLAQASEALSGSLDPSATLSSVTRLVVPEFADWCAVAMVEPGGEIRNVTVTHTDPEKVRYAEELQKRYPPQLDAPTGVAHVIRAGRSELYREIDAEMMDRAGVDEERRKVIQDTGMHSVMIVPMTVRGRSLGAITFVRSETPASYGPEDLRLAEELATRAALALDNAALFAERGREVQERRRAEEEVRRLNEELERRVHERTAELEAFCYSVSHDLRTPLRGIDGFSRATLQEYGHVLEEEGRGYLERVRAGARRMDELITALLALSRFTRAEIRRVPVDMSKVAEETGHEIIGGGRAVLTVQPGMRAEADPKMLRVLLDNLLSNAVKFSGRSPEPRVEVGQTAEGAFYVRDNGVGFNPAYVSKLFTPFERLHTAEEFAGSGIGLATVQRIALKHGGQVWAESEEGKGATFFFTLP